MTYREIRPCAYCGGYCQPQGCPSVTVSLISEADLERKVKEKSMLKKRRGGAGKPGVADAVSTCKSQNY